MQGRAASQPAPVQVELGCECRDYLLTSDKSPAADGKFTMVGIKYIGLAKGWERGPGEEA